jgi:hypothetical protein
MMQEEQTEKPAYISPELAKKLECFQYCLDKLMPRKLTLKSFVRIYMFTASILSPLAAILIYYMIPLFGVVISTDTRVEISFYYGVGTYLFKLLDPYLERYISNPIAYGKDVREYLTACTQLLEKENLTPEEKREISAICERARIALRKTTLFSTRATSTDFS